MDYRNLATELVAAEAYTQIGGADGGTDDVGGVDEEHAGELAVQPRSRPRTYAA